MAVRRRIGDLASVLLKAHLAQVDQQRQYDLQRRNQQDLAAARDADRRATAEDTRNHSLLTAGLADPKQMESLANAGINIGDIDPNRFRPPIESLIANTGAQIEKAKTRQELPTQMGAEMMLGAQPWGTQAMKDPRAVKSVIDVADNRRGMMDQVDAYETDRLGANAFAQSRGQGMGTESANAENAPAQLERKKTEFNAMTPLETKRAGSIAGAQESARLSAEWMNPQVVAAMLDFEKQKRIGELAALGDKIQAEEVAKRNVAVKGLLPTYQQYRTLAVELSQKFDNYESRAAVFSSMGKLPWIGGFLQSGAETAHAMVAPDQQTAQKVAELNRLTDTLAQGMANAVLGNRGQTTENDRATAKNILVNSFTSAKSAQDLLAITDRLMTIAPTIGAANPTASASEILTQAAAQAQQEISGQGAGSAPQQSSAQQKLSTLRSR